MQIKTTIRYHYKPIRISKVKIATPSVAAQNAEKVNCSYTARGNVNGRTSLENSLAFSKRRKKKIEHAVTIQPSNCIPGHL